MFKKHIIGLLVCAVIFISCEEEALIDTTPSYSIEKEEILLQSFKIYRDEISVFYTKKTVKQTNPNAIVTEKDIQQRQHYQDSIELSKAFCHNKPDRYEIVWYFPVTVKVNGQASSIDKYISYEPNYLSNDYTQKTYEEKKHIIDTLHIETLIKAVSSAYLYGWCISKSFNDGYTEKLTGFIDFHSRSDKDCFSIADSNNPSAPSAIGTQLIFESSLFNIPSYNTNVESYFKLLYNLAYDRFNGRSYYDADGNKYVTEVSESTLDKISGFNTSGVVDNLDYMCPYFPTAEYIYPTIRFYKNDVFIHETVLTSYWEYFYYDPDKESICTALEFGSLLLKDKQQIFYYCRTLNGYGFEYEIADYSTGEQIWSNKTIALIKDEKPNDKGALSYE